MTYILVVLGLVVSFYLGVVFGIVDCKRRYAIPKEKYFDEVENDC